MSALVSPDRPEAPLFSDGLGDRVVSTDPATGELVQVLRLNPSLTAVPSFEFALRERVARLANFRHLYFARVRRVDRAPSHATALSIVSDHVEGTRLSEILRTADERQLHLDINAAMYLVRQLVPAIALLHENARDAAHGLVGLERLIVTPQGRLVVAEHVCGGAVEQMQFGRERLWHEFRVSMPPTAGIPRFDGRADVTGIGVVALSLVLGRPLRDDEFPRGLADLLNTARERTAFGEEQPLSPALRSWLARALQVDVRRAFASAPEALGALDELSADGSMYVAAPVALETFLSRYISALLVPPAPVAVPEAEMISAPAPATDAVMLAPEITELLTEPLPDAPLEPEPEPAPFFEPDAAVTPEAAPAPSAAPGPGNRRRWLAAASMLVVLTSVGLAAFRSLTGGGTTPALATLSVQSNPPGVPIFIDGVERGVTPARLTLAPGAHILELRRGVPRVIPLTLAAGADVSQYLEFAGVSAGEQLILPEAAPPEPAAAPAPSAPVAGWIAAKAPFIVEIHEKGRLLGTTEADRIMLAAGPHELEFVNETLGYRATRSVQVGPGRLSTIELELPHGVVNLNASPWAEVYIDGKSVGETPIGNLAVPIGPHEILFRHPQFGEKRHAVSVTTGLPVRLSVEMNK